MSGTLGPPERRAVRPAAPARAPAGSLGWNLAGDVSELGVVACGAFQQRREPAERLHEQRMRGWA